VGKVAKKWQETKKVAFAPEKWLCNNPNQNHFLALNHQKLGEKTVNLDVLEKSPNLALLKIMK